MPAQQNITANPELEEVGEDEGFETIEAPKSVPRLKGKQIAKIVRILVKRPENGSKVTRYIFEIQLEKLRADGSFYIGQYNCAKSWKPGSEYQFLASKVLGREFTAEDEGVRPIELKDKPFIVTVTEHRRKSPPEGEPESIIKIGEIHALSEADSVAA